MSVWKPPTGEWMQRGGGAPPPQSYGADPGPPVGLTYVPPPPTNPFGGQPLPPNFPKQPTKADFTYRDAAGNQQYDAEGYLSAMDRWYGMAADLAEYGEEGFGPSGPSPAELAIERSKVHAQNMATFLDATVAELDAEIAADRLNLDQAEAEFNRRMDAFAEGGKQMEGMWQWTSAPGQKTLLTDVRAGLGMEPWKATAQPFDPFAMAWDIVEQTPEILQTQPDFDPLQQALDLMEQFV